MKLVGVKELKTKPSAYIKEAQKGNPIIITVGRKVSAALIPLKEEEIEDFLLAYHPRFRRQIEAGIRDVEQGETVSLKQLLEETDHELGRQLQSRRRQARRARTEETPR